MYIQLGQSRGTITTVTAYPTSCRQPLGPMSFAPMAASYQVRPRTYLTIKKMPKLAFSGFTYAWNDPVFFFPFLYNTYSSINWKIIQYSNVDHLHRGFPCICSNHFDVHYYFDRPATMRPRIIGRG